jgi:hypothetical protein
MEIEVPSNVVFVANLANTPMSRMSRNLKLSGGKWDYEELR